MVMMMKYIPVILITILFSCKKDDNPPVRENKWLKDQSLNNIKLSLQDEWQLHYSNGGITGAYSRYKNSYITFTPDDVHWTVDGKVVADYKMQWTHVKDVMSDSTYQFFFRDIEGWPYAWIAEQIKDDTLIIYENYYDGRYYFLTRK